MIHLTYSNRTEALFEQLARDLDAHYSGQASRLDPALLVVPSRTVDVWLRRALARRDGIAANLNARFLRGFVSDLLERAAPGTRVVDTRRTFDAVLGLFLDDKALKQPGFGPVLSYLRAGGEGRDAMDLRRVQLATQLSRVFEEYAYSRPEMLREWAKGKRVLKDVGAETEAWQSQVWRAALGPGAKLEEGLLRLHEVPDRLSATALAGQPPVFLFGLSYVASLYHHVLSNVSRHAELHLYTLNPCLEFWEDVASVKELRRGERLARKAERKGIDAVLATEDPFGLTRGEDPPPLVLWGRPGRENVRLLNELSACDFHDAFEDPLDDGATLLHQLQHDILARESERLAPDPSFHFAGDESLQFLACPNAQREAEAIASEIVALVQAGEARLKFSDIAVLVAGADPGVYFSHFKAAFSQRSFEIPCTVDEAASAAPSPMAEAAELLLALPLGTFARSLVLRLVTHPAVAGRFPDIDPAEWVARCDSLGIFRGASREDLAGTYVETDLHNWDQGLRRLALGGAMTGGKSGDGREYALGGERYLVEEHAEEVEGSSARFGVLVRSLLNDACYLRGAEHTAAEWAELLTLLLDTYLSPRSEDAERDRDRCLQAVRAVGELELGGKKVTYRVASEFAREALSGLPAPRSGFVGVTVSTMQPMRALPFRVVFVAGLGEGRFPSPSPRDTLDLRLAKPRPGDVNAREQDQYMFLEAMLCAREKLYLSYVARNELTGEPLEPSSVVAELQRMVRRGYVADPVVREVRLRRFDLELFPDLFGKAPASVPSPPEARLEAQMLALRRQLEAQGLTRLEPESVKKALGEARWKKLEARLAVNRAPDAAALFRDDGLLRINLSSLRKFLECPLQGAARALLRLEEDEEDLAAVDDEPFDAGRLQDSTLERGTFERLVRATGPMPVAGEVLDQVAMAPTAAGQLPAGLFAQLSREDHLQVIDQWSTSFFEHLSEQAIANPRPEFVRFGGAAEHEDVDEALDAISLGAVGPVRVELVGRTGLLLNGRTHSLTVRKRSKKSPAWLEEAYQAQESLYGFFDHLALSAAGHVAERAAVVLRVYASGVSSPQVTRFRALSQEEARAYLARLVSAMLADVHDYLLPATAVFGFVQAEAQSETQEVWRNDRAAAGDKPPPYGAIRDVAPGRKHTVGRGLVPRRDFATALQFAELVEVALDKKACASLYGPIPNPTEFSAPADARARQLIEQRFGLYFASRLPDAKTPRSKSKAAAEEEPA